MLCLLDANVLIGAHNDYYPIDRMPQFWEWLTREEVAVHASRFNSTRRGHRIVLC